NVAHVRNRSDEGGWIVEDVLVDQRCPELQRLLELSVDDVCLRGIDRAVGSLRRVVELTKSGVTGASVVPSPGALLANRIQALVGDNRPVRTHACEEHAERSAHDAATDEDD